MKKTIIAALGVLIVVALPITRDEIHWCWTSYKDEATGYVSYIMTWPEGRHVIEARARLHYEHTYARLGEEGAATDKAAEYSDTILKNALDFNETRKPHEEPKDIGALFLSLDEKSKNADLIYRRAVNYFEKDPNFPINEAEYRGLSYLNIVKDHIVLEDSVKERLYDIAMTDVKKLLEKRNMDLHGRETRIDNIYQIVNILKDDNVLKEKLYCFVRDNIDNSNFWDNFYQIRGFSTEPIRKLHAFVFQQIKNYKHTTDWYKRFIYANETPAIDEDLLKNQSDRIGTKPQPRTIVAIGGSYNILLKNEMKGNVFFTDDIEKACAIIHDEEKSYLWKTFEYTGGRLVEYYNVTETVKIFSVNRKLLYSKSLSGKFSKPYNFVSQGTTVVYARPKGGVNMAELVKILEKEFAKCK